MSNPGRTTPTRVERAQNADNGWRKRIDGFDRVAAIGGGQ